MESRHESRARHLAESSTASFPLDAEGEKKERDFVPQWLRLECDCERVPEASPDWLTRLVGRPLGPNRFRLLARIAEREYNISRSKLSTARREKFPARQSEHPRSIFIVDAGLSLLLGQFYAERNIIADKANFPRRKSARFIDARLPGRRRNARRCPLRVTAPCREIFARSALNRSKSKSFGNLVTS